MQNLTEMAAAEKAFRLKQLASESAKSDMEAEVAAERAKVAKAEAAVAERAQVAKAEAAAAAERLKVAKIETSAAQAAEKLKWAELRKTKVRLWLPIGAVVGLGVYLFGDWWYHDCETGIKWRMKNKLRGCPVPATAGVQPPKVLPTHQQQPLLDFLPLMVLGPTGCGKSTLLAKLARDSARGSGERPAAATVLIPLLSGAATADTDGAAVLHRLKKIAERVYEHIDFPRDHSVVFNIGHWFSDLGAEPMLEGPFGLEVARAILDTRERLLEALDLLYHACAELQAERMKQGLSRLDAPCVIIFDDVQACAELQAERMKQGLSRLDAPCVIIFDDVQELTRDKLLAAVGGRGVFADIGRHAVFYAVDFMSVRTVVAGSSAFLAHEFEKTGVATGTRLDSFTLQDPDRETVLAQLVARGYTAEEATRILSTSGPRLRLLQGPLEYTVRPTDVEGWVRDTEDTAVLAFNAVFRGLSEDDCRHFMQLLDKLEAAANLGKGVPIQGLAKQWTGYDDSIISKAVYLDNADVFHFQSELHRRVWATLRPSYERYAVSAASEQMR